MPDDQKAFTEAWQKLWDHMAGEHDLHLLDSELYEIELLAAKVAEERGTIKKRPQKMPPTLSPETEIAPRGQCP
jgi:uncharacterized membrane-anchored protein YhcB (DUF1043 family)